MLQRFPQERKIVSMTHDLSLGDGDLKMTKEELAASKESWLRFGHRFFFLPVFSQTPKKLIEVRDFVY